MQARWPKANEQALERDVIEIVIQVNGKTRDKLQVAAGASAESIEADVLALDSLQKWLTGKTVRKVVVVPGRLVNLAVS